MRAFLFLTLLALAISTITAALITENKLDLEDSMMMVPKAMYGHLLARDGPASSPTGASVANPSAATSPTPTTAATPPAPKKKSVIYASPEILMNGTLFYIAVSVSTLLWCTGKGIDMTINRQERFAEKAAYRY
ncbi:hypothetical protein DFQ28_009615 [Apophysomyces sp. BC1034]|nr:hypothetical protein DFQ30_003598 [Apophysomyces sp. BC1015]KAG0172669.1 hypothetical protein DFQ29_008280 [Apophysomyces sp. BC1021]KAG0185275.1 hypothetical protein DFQ28_009615 [Apophysomyces sp. BC1034]